MEHQTQFAKPAAGLEQFIRFYQQRDFQIAQGLVRHPVPARAAPLIVLELGDPVSVLSVDEGRRIVSPMTVVVGLQTTRRLEMELCGNVSTLAIMFQPDGVQRLFSFPSRELPNRGEDAHAVLGACISQLRQTVGDGKSFCERVRILDTFFLRRAVQAAEANSMSRAVSHVVRERGCISMRALSDGIGLSPRHFARRFMDHMGMRPKLFTRIVRFQAALESKALHPLRNWTHVAQDLGYFDQMHLIHDFEELAGGSPKEMLAHFETHFGEEIRRMQVRPVADIHESTPRLTL